MRFLVVFTIFFSVYGAASYYVFVRGRWLFPANSAFGGLYLPLFLMVVLAFPAGRFLERAAPNAVTGTLVWLGSFWLAALLYFVLLLAAVDLFRLFARFMGVRSFGAIGVTITGSVLCGLVILLVAGGFANAKKPTLRNLEITVPLRGRPAPNLPNPLVVAVASDIHIGNTMGPEKLGRIVDLLNSTDPDLVLLVGDTVDEDVEPVLKRDFGKTLLRLRSRLGVYAVTGNHEYLGNAEKACRYLADHAVRMLRDDFVNLKGLWIIGREDPSLEWVTGRERLALPALINRARPDGPVILLDHQPFHLEHAAESRVDFQLSGHTHHGQLLPLNFITGKIYEKDWGYLRKDGTQYYVSCGAGTWGTPVRTTSRPEVICVRVRFER
ncbi:MAG: metallophosphoesterase [Acidobacteria bacterium]|nr:MAG: metallophosphoesterase [Acidobacteriota bacterium]